MPETPELTTWERYKAKMAALGIDPLGPPVGEDDPHFDDFQSILAELGGIAPLPPLPPNWEGNRPVDYDGTLAGIGRWLDFEWRQTVAQGIFPGAGQASLAHLNAVVRNVYRAIAYFHIADPPTRGPCNRNHCRKETYRWLGGVCPIQAEVWMAKPSSRSAQGRHCRNCPLGRPWNWNWCR